MKNYYAYIITIVPTVLVLAILLLANSSGYNGNLVNDYHLQAEQVISRSGGLNDGAKRYLDNLSKNKFKGMFSVSSNQSKVNNGDSIKYVIHGHIPSQVNLQGIHKSIDFTQSYITKASGRADSVEYR